MTLLHGAAYTEHTAKCQVSQQVYLMRVTKVGGVLHCQMHGTRKQMPHWANSSIVRAICSIIQREKHKTQFVHYST